VFTIAPETLQETSTGTGAHKSGASTAGYVNAVSAPDGGMYGVLEQRWAKDASGKDLADWYSWADCTMGDKFANNLLKAAK
jgi:hypothetical protein